MTAHVLRYHPRRRNLRRGFGLLDVLLSLGVAAIAITGYLQWQADTSATLKAGGASDFMSTVAAASQSYLNANASVISQNLGSGGAVAIPLTGSGTVYGLPSLQASGMLPSTFINQDSYGQSASLLIRNVAATGNTPAHLEGLLTTTGGAAMSDHDLGIAVEKMGGIGGSLQAHPPVGSAGTTVLGNGGAWSSPVSNWSAANVPLRTGHLMASVTQLGAPVSEFLDRFNTGNPEANTMHTSINVNGNNLNAVNTTDTQTLVNNTQSGQFQGSVHVGGGDGLVIDNGGMACQGNATGCGWRISDDGGFYDMNDGWITYKSNYQGLKLDSSAKLEADSTSDLKGAVTAENGIEITAGNAQVDGNGSFAFGSYGAGLNMTDNQWIRAYGGNGFQGISTNIVQAATFQDKANPSYYVQPSQTSYLHQLSVDNNLSVGGNESVAGNLAVGGNSAVSGNETIAGNQSVTGADTVNGTITGNSNLQVMGNSYFQGYTATGGNAYVNGSVITNQNVFAAGAGAFTGGVVTNGAIWWQGGPNQGTVYAGAGNNNTCSSYNGKTLANSITIEASGALDWCDKNSVSHTLAYKTN